MDDNTRAVLDTISEAEDKKDDPTTFTTSNGVVFKVNPVSPLLVMEAKSRLPLPKPPKIRVEDKETYEENLHDPEYNRQLQEYQYRIAQTTNAILIVRGTTLISVPPAIESADDEGWAEDIEMFGELEIPPVGSRKRYFLWVKYVALPMLSDWQGLLGKVMEAGGQTLEADVAVAAESFRGDEEGDINPGLRIASENGRGN